MSTSTQGADGRSHWNVPNTLTWLRILMIPAILALFYLLPYPWADPAACAAFALAGITDSLDGYYARKLGQTSRLGAFLDPVADKLIVATALVLLVEADPRRVVAIAAAIIIGREITVSALREWMSQIGARANVAVSWLGKLKTASQIVGIGLMLYREPFLGPSMYTLGEWLLYAAVALTLWSMIDYLRAAGPAMRASD